MLIDGADVRSVDPASLRREIAVVTDDPFLFSATVHDNIAYARPDATRADVDEAARRAHADGFVRELPDGYDTMIGERGLTLSGGQRQRIAIARALLANPRILVLDDATSSVDASTEQEIKLALGEVMEGRTTFVIAHRLSTIALADEIVVLERGRIVAQGTHDELLAQEGLYREIVEKGLPDQVFLTRKPIEEATRRRPLETRAPRVRAGAGRRGLRLAPPPPPAPTRASARLPQAPSARHHSRPRAGPPRRAATPPAPDRRPRAQAARPDRAAAAVSWAGRADVPDADRRDRRRARADPTGDEGDRRGHPAARRERARRGSCWSSLAATLVTWGASAAQTFLTGWVGQRALQDLRVQLFRHLQSLSLGFYSRVRAGVVISRLTNDVEALDSLVSDGIVTLFQSTLTLVGVVVILVVLDAELALWTFLAIPLMAAAALAFRIASADAFRRTRERIGAITGYLQETLSGIRVVRSFGQEERHIGRFADLNTANRDANMTTVYLNAAYFPGVELLSSLVTVGILLIGGFQVIDGQTQTGIVFGFIAALNQFFDPIQQLSQLYTTYQSGMAALDKIFELLDEEPELVDRPGAVQLDGLRGELSFEDVSFRYGEDDDGAWALRDSICMSRPGRRSRSSARPAPASRRSQSSSLASTTRRRVS